MFRLIFQAAYLFSTTSNVLTPLVAFSVILKLKYVWMFSGLWRKCSLLLLFRSLMTFRAFMAAAD